ncbi:MAG: aldose 1-epimerase family protein [Coriobacteriaceae bacterium]|nr:aldose 1-epimerase family protein [Coriobacteriaceae bacterium]MDD7583820.1 aldose 1-epimerase family protein [Coriobacteriaceae bacterium]
MVEILGRAYGCRELAEYFGDISCVAGMRRFELVEGRACGVRLTQVRTGSGLEFEVNETRGMDIGRFSFRGVPIAYSAYGAECHPAYFEARDDGWLRSYGGGLLVMGGLRSTGSPCVDNGEAFPLHGRISNAPASFVCAAEVVDPDGTVAYEVSGDVRESKALDHNLVLHRTVRSRQGEDALYIEDTVENQGFSDQELMLLYHFNIGHPIVDEGARLLVHSSSVVPRDENAERQPEPYDTYIAPVPCYKDIVYYHRLESASDGMATAAIVNEKIGLGVYLKFDTHQLPCFTQWKFLGQGNYVAGIEPGNAFVSGRQRERAQRGLEVLPARGCKHISIEVGVLSTTAEISAYQSANGFQSLAREGINDEEV